MTWLDECCPICGHEWRRHDPEDGRCDVHATVGIGPCKCDRDLGWMQRNIAYLSRTADELNALRAAVIQIHEDECGCDRPGDPVACIALSIGEVAAFCEAR